MEAPAVILHRYGEAPVLDTVRLDAPGPGEVLVEMVASGICHTDLSYVRDARTVPVLLGHEGAGVVRALGCGVRTVAEGDTVVINWQPKCGRCRNCQRGRQDLCENVAGTGAPRVFWRDAPLSVMLNAGTFCRFVVVPEGGAVPVSPKMPFAKAALLGCGVATGVGAALYTARVEPGDDVVVLGCGGVGLNVVQGARLAQARTVIAVDRDDTRRDLARRYGATHVFPAVTELVTEEVRSLTQGRGVDHVFEVVGLPDLMLQGIDHLARGGTLTLVGAAARDAALPLQPRRFMSQQQNLRGCIYGNIRPTRDLPLFAELYLRGELLLDELEGRHLRLEDVPRVFTGEFTDLGVRPIVRFE
jgi:S-(hydroxymethyl)glutathione dehydrogenase/alcohol dehydrogenase